MKHQQSSVIDYDRWIGAYDTIRDSDRIAIRAHAAALSFQPNLSVVMPIGKGRAEHARASVTSMINQLYQKWELCLTYVGEQESEIESLLAEIAGTDPRVKAARLDGEDRMIDWNAAINLATGDFVTFLCPGDLLSERALYEVAVELGRTPLPDLVYTDEDRIDASGRRCDVRFKPGWDPDLLLAENYVGNLAVYRRSLLDAVGRYRPGFDGAEDYDRVLRVTAATTADRVRHIPTVLYHRKLAEGDADRNIDAAVEKLKVTTASRRAVRDHLLARGDRGASLEPAPLAPLSNRVVWPLPMPMPMVSVIVPIRDRPELLERCAEGVLQRTDYSNLELLIVDNDSCELTSHALLERLKADNPTSVRVLPYPGRFNYSAMNNAAADQARGDVLLLLNNDVDVIDAGWLREMVLQVVRLDVGAVGAKLLYIDQRVQHAGVVLGPAGQITHLLRRSRRDDPGYGNQLALARTFTAVTGACLAIRKSVYVEVGGLDEVNLPVSFNDIDLCLRIGDFGYRVVWTPAAELFHLESASRGHDAELPRFQREWRHMRRTWGNLLEDADPFHNPNTHFHWDRADIPCTPRKPNEVWRRLAQVIGN